MRNRRLTIAYEGTRYAGWQFQKNARTVQGEIENALGKVLGEKVKLAGSGRTDSGVHAKAQVANFRTKKDIPLTNLQNALNAHLPGDISIIGLKKAHPKFHSRFDAKGKAYRYTILNSRIDNPFLRRFYWKIPYALDIGLLKREAKALVGRHDFKSFQAKSDKSAVKNAKRTIKTLKIRKKGRFIIIDIEADGFLYNMARNIVGTLIEVARGYLPEGATRRILLSRDRCQAGPTAPAKGLTLQRVRY